MLPVNGPYLSEEKILHSPHPACDMRLDKICLGGMAWPVAQLSDHSNHTLSLQTGHCFFWVSGICQFSPIQLTRIFFFVVVVIVVLNEFSKIKAMAVEHYSKSLIFLQL